MRLFASGPQCCALARQPPACERTVLQCELPGNSVFPEVGVNSNVLFSLLFCNSRWTDREFIPIAPLLWPTCVNCETGVCAEFCNWLLLRGPGRDWGESSKFSAKFVLTICLVMSLSRDVVRRGLPLPRLMGGMTLDGLLTVDSSRCLPGTGLVVPPDVSLLALYKLVSKFGRRK